jgi:hypothetical protein
MRLDNDIRWSSGRAHGRGLAMQLCTYECENLSGRFRSQSCACCTCSTCATTAAVSTNARSILRPSEAAPCVPIRYCALSSARSFSFTGNPLGDKEKALTFDQGFFDLGPPSCAHALGRCPNHKLR